MLLGEDSHSEVVHRTVANPADETVLLVEGPRVMPPVLLAADAEAEPLEGLRQRRRVDHVRVLVELLRRQPKPNQTQSDTKIENVKSSWFTFVCMRIRCRYVCMYVSLRVHTRVPNMPIARLVERMAGTLGGRLTRTRGERERALRHNALRLTPPRDRQNALRFV